MNNQNFYTLENVDQIMHEIYRLLMNSQKLAKCLKFNSKDALSQSDLSQSEIFDVFDIEKESCRVFDEAFELDTTTENRSEIRIYLFSGKPDSKYLISSSFAIEIIVYNQLRRLDNGKKRDLVLANEVLNVLNGAYVKGIGKLVFNNRLQFQRWNKNYSGYALLADTKMR